MYSVVLMMALTSGGGVTDFGHHGGCCGGEAYSCCGGGYSSCCGGGYSSCCGGGHHRLFGGHHHGCCGGYSSCCGGYSGCCGGAAYSGCCGGAAYSGCCGGAAYSGCCGGYVAPADCGCGAPVVSGGCIGGHEVIIQDGHEHHEGVKKEEEIKKPAPKEEKKPEEEIKKPAPKPEAAIPAPATIVVTLPADAKLTIDDAATTSTASPRVFTSPALPVGHDYHYTLKAEMVRNGKPVVISRQVTVRAGEESRVNMEAGLAGVASR